MTYTIEYTIPYPIPVVWGLLSDLTHFERNDARLNDFELLGSQDKGTGTQFKIKHTIWPIFPFLPNEVVCTVTDWMQNKKLEVKEENEKAHRTHTQTFLLFEEEQTPSTTTIQYEIRFLYPRSHFFFWDFIVMFMSMWRMKQKLLAIEKDCAKWQKECDAHNSILAE